MRSVWRPRVLAATRRLLRGCCCCCELKVGEACRMELRKWMMRMGERMRHQWLLERRVIPAASTAHVRLEVASRQLIHAQRIVDVARVGADRVAVNDGKFVVEEWIEPMVLVKVVWLVHRLRFDVNIVRQELLLLFLDVVLRQHSIRLLVILVLPVPPAARFVALQLIHERRHHLMIIVVMWHDWIWRWWRGEKIDWWRERGWRWLETRETAETTRARHRLIQRLGVIVWRLGIIDGTARAKIIIGSMIL